MATTNLTGLAGMIVNLTFREMTEFSGAIKSTGYDTEKAHTEKILTWAEDVIREEPAPEIKASDLVVSPFDPPIVFDASKASEEPL